MSVTVKVEGLRDVERVLRQLPKATAKASMRRLLKAAGQPIADAGAGNAPKDQGHLAASYGVGTKLSRRQRRLHKRESEVEVFVGPGADPAAVQTEFGNEHQSAHPHLRPAWNAKKAEALQIIIDGIWAEVEKTVARYARRLARGTARRR